MGNVNSLSSLIERAVDGGKNLAWELGVQYAANVYYLQDNLESLETSLGDLQALRTQLRRRIGYKQGYGKQTDEKVDLWVQRVDKELARGDELKTEGDSQVDRLCLAGICSMRYCSTSAFGGKVCKCLKGLNTLKTEGEGFTDEDLVVDAAVELDLGAKMSCDSVGLEAKLDEVLTYLNQENVGIVGIYGQGGVGKTTLLKNINNHYVSRSENFLVVWIDVPKDVNLEAIQQAIGEKIGLPDELKVSSMEEKASYISKSLQQKKIILLLDDIRAAIDLSKIGIPPSDSLNYSKVAFTTRPEHACREMEPGRCTSVKTLAPKQAWQLFVKRVGEDIINSHPQIKELARKVAKKCGGLPLALSLIGKAMSCEREPNVWKQTVRTFERPSLQHSKSHQETNGHGMTKLFSVLRYSYDSLPDETYKSCFLHCALFPEADLIRKAPMMDCWAFGDFLIDSDEDDLVPYYEAYRILNVLFSSCLLEDEKDCVRMHDVVRSMALWIAKEDTLVMSKMELEEAPSVGRWTQMKRVSLMYNDIKELTQDITCAVWMPNLRRLPVYYCEELREIISRDKLGNCGEEVYPIFSSLAVLELGNLPMLESIYPSNTLSLRFLYELKVENCPQLKELPLDPNDGVLGCSQIELEAKQEWWDAIEWEDDAAKAALLPRFNLNYLR